MVDRQSSYTYEEILKCGEGELFGPDNAKLPLPPMLISQRASYPRRGRQEPQGAATGYNIVGAG